MATPRTIDPELEKGYNVRAARSDYDRVLDDWISRSEDFRARADASLDIAYGRAARRRLDVFRAGRDAPTLVYLHGGYWQRGDKSVYAFVAEPFVHAGVNVVVLGYTLCPDTTVPGITREIREGLAWLYREGGEYGLDPGRINLSGHSAGGHLTAMMLATDWPECGAGLPADLVKSGIPISGLYDLSPLQATSINELAGIDGDTAARFSPCLLKPFSDAPVLAVVGGVETGAFHHQTAAFVEAWSQAGVKVESYVEPGVDHFDIVNRLADPNSDLLARTLGWLR